MRQASSSTTVENAQDAQFARNSPVMTSAHLFHRNASVQLRSCNMLVTENAHALFVEMSQNAPSQNVCRLTIANVPVLKNHTSSTRVNDAKDVTSVSATLALR